MATLWLQNAVLNTLASFVYVRFIIYLASLLAILRVKLVRYLTMLLTAFAIVGNLNHHFQHQG